MRPCYSDRRELWGRIGESTKVLDAEENFEEALRAKQRAREVLGEGNAQANDGYSRAEAALKQSKEKIITKSLVGQADKRKSRKRIASSHSNTPR